MLDRLFGNRSRLPFPLILSVRSQALHQPISSLLTILAFAASVGLATSVELATRSVGAALEETTNALVGSAQLEVTAGDAGVPDALLESLRTIPGVASASPMIEHTFRVAEGDRDGEAVRVVALDLLYESEVRSYQVSQGGFAVRDPLRLVSASNAIMISEALADRLGIGEGSPLPLRSPQGRHEFVVRGTLNGELSEAFGGQIALMDVFGLQTILEMGPRVDRIDVAVAAGHDLEATKKEIEAQVGDLGTVRASSLRQIYVDSVLGTLSAGLWVVAVMGILLAVFLAYSVTSLSVDRRVEELALLRAAGMQGRSVSSLVVIDTTILAALGTVLGFAAATLLSDSLVAIFSRSSAYLQHIVIQPVEARTSTLLVAFGVGVPVALLASIEPALRAGRRAPLDVLHGYRLLPSSAAASRPMLALGATAAALGLACAVGLEAVPVSVRLVGAIGLGVLAVGAGVTQLLLLAFRPLQRLLGRLVPRVGYLVGSYLLERPVETGATLAVCAAVTGGLLAVLSMVNSIATTVDDYWVGVMGESAVWTFAQDPLASRDRELIRNDTIDVMRRTPGVLTVAESYIVTTFVRGEEVILGSLPIDALVEHSGGARSISSQAEQTISALRRGELVMSEAFEHHFGVDVGDEIQIATRKGARRFRIGGFAHAWVGRTGALYLDVDAFKRWFDPLGSIQVALWTREPRQDVLDRIQRQTDQPLFFRYGELLAKHTALVIGKFKDLMMVPVSLLGAIGLIAVVNLLFGNVVARRRDLTLIRASGGTSANLVVLVLTNGVIVGAVGTACGLVLGFVWAGIVSETVAGSLGYHVVSHLDWWAAGWIALVALVLSILSGLGPALMRRAPFAEGYVALS